MAVAENRPHTRDVGAQCRHCTRRRIVAPHRLGERVERDRLAEAGEQHGKDPSLGRTPERDSTSVGIDQLHRTEYSELHGRTPYGLWAADGLQSSCNPPARCVLQTRRMTPRSSSSPPVGSRTSRSATRSCAGTCSTSPSLCNAFATAAGGRTMESSALVRQRSRAPERLLERRDAPPTPIRLAGDARRGRGVLRRRDGRGDAVERVADPRSVRAGLAPLGSPAAAHPPARRPDAPPTCRGRRRADASGV